MCKAEQRSLSIPFERNGKAEVLQVKMSRVLRNEDLEIAPRIRATQNMTFSSHSTSRATVLYNVTKRKVEKGIQAMQFTGSVPIIDVGTC